MIRLADLNYTFCFREVVQLSRLTAPAAYILLYSILVTHVSLSLSSFSLSRKDFLVVFHLIVCLFLYVVLDTTTTFK